MENLTTEEKPWNVVRRRTDLGYWAGILYPPHQIEDGHSDPTFPDFKPSSRKVTQVHSFLAMDWMECPMKALDEINIR